MADALADGRRLRVLCVVDDFTREALATMVDTSISGARVVRELERLVTERRLPAMIVSDNGTELTSVAVLRWADERGIEWHYIAPGKPQQNAFVESFMYGRPPRCKGERTLGGGRVRSCIRPVDAALMTAGPDGVRGSAPNQRGGLCAPKALLALPIPGPAGSPSRRHRPRTSWALGELAFVRPLRPAPIGTPRRWSSWPTQSAPSCSPARRPRPFSNGERQARRSKPHPRQPGP